MTESVYELYLSAAKRFVHSIVLVDDLARLAPDEDDEIPEELNDPRPIIPPAEELPPNASEVAEIEAVQDAATGVGDENRLDAGALIERFARLGMVCAALRPEGDAAGVEELVAKAVERCDIVTLDWHLATPDDGGAKALQILDQISASRRSIGLVAVYTGDPQAQEIVDAILGLDDVEELAPFVFRRRGTRIVILFKEGTRLPAVSQAEIVAVDDLPGRLLLEFSMLAAGLVPSATMSALGAVRENFHEVLAVLHDSHDPAFVGHRMAQPDPDDATDHVVDLVVSELRSIIEDDQSTSDMVGREAVDRWIADRGSEELAVGVDTLNELNLRGGSDEARALVTQHHEEYAKFKKKHPTMLVLGGSEPAAEMANARLAERMTVRHSYRGGKARRLELGVVLRDADARFWVCIQPLCDSVRIKTETRRMPLLPYETVAPDKKFDLVLTVEAELVYLRLESHPSAIVVVEFPVDMAAEAVLPHLTGNDWTFADSAGATYTYERRLKSEHAQRLVQHLGVVLSRVGLNESEWLRLKALGKPT